MTPKTEPPPEAEILSDAFANAAKAIRPSVVRLDVEMKRTRDEMAQGPQPWGPAPPPGLEDFFERFFDFGFGDRILPPPGPARGTGSGVVIDAAGHIVTNSHVVRGASRVTIAFSDGQKYAGKVVGTDPYTDVGVVRFEKKPEALTVARLGSSDDLRVGQWVIAVGSPLGLTQTVTAGIVSGLGRTGGRIQLSGERVRRYVQTDALINPGNSGGPLVNLRGEVVGINSVINVGPGGSYGFAIPIKQVSQVAQTIVKEGRVRYPYIGVMIGNLEDIPPEQRGEIGRNLPDKGVVVTEVTPGGPAAQAGGGAESVQLMYLMSIAAARSTVRLSMAYFVPDNVAVNTMVAARNRGVCVQMILPGAHTDRAILRRASRFEWGPLLRAGVEIHEYQPTMYHCKVMIVDEVWTSVGSTNFDSRSFSVNDEANLNIHDAGFAWDQAATFERDLRESHRVTLAEWESRPWSDKFLDALAGLLSSQL